MQNEVLNTMPDNPVGICGGYLLRAEETVLLGASISEVTAADILEIWRCMTDGAGTLTFAVPFVLRAPAGPLTAVLGEAPPHVPDTEDVVCAVLTGRSGITLAAADENMLAAAFRALAQTYRPFHARRCEASGTDDLQDRTIRWDASDNTEVDNSYENFSMDV
ncbi:MAG: hypothetical protein J6S76_03645 [Clostridia bacterium]|nr:hypothetical protein [Clostridia bacterium]